MARGNHISLMADEVLRDIANKKVGFHLAFSWAAHRRGIRHSESTESREQYNTWFRQVRDCISKRQRAALSNALKGERPWQHGKIHSNPNTSRRRKWRPDDPWGHEDQANFVFQDNNDSASSDLEVSHSPLPDFFFPRGRIKPGIRNEPPEL